MPSLLELEVMIKLQSLQLMVELADMRLSTITSLSVDGKHTDKVETPLHTNSVVKSPASVSSKHIRFEEEQLAEFSDDYDGRPIGEAEALPRETKDMGSKRDWNPEGLVKRKPEPESELGTVTSMSVDSELCRVASLLTDSGRCRDCIIRDSHSECGYSLLLLVSHESVPQLAVRRSVRISSGLVAPRLVVDYTYDTVESNGNYISGETLVTCSVTVVLWVSPHDECGDPNTVWDPGGLGVRMLHSGSKLCKVASLSLHNVL